MQQISSMSQLGDLIRQTRKAQKLTQIQLAQVSGVGANFIRDVEHGKATCQVGKVIQLAHMLGLKIMLDKR